MLTVLAVAAAVAVGWLVWEFVHAPRLDFDEHTRTALALLQPDHPELPDDTPLADEVEGWLAARTPTIRPAFPEES